MQIIIKMLTDYKKVTTIFLSGQIDKQKYKKFKKSWTRIHFQTYDVMSSQRSHPVLYYHSVLEFILSYNVIQLKMSSFSTMSSCLLTVLEVKTVYESILTYDGILS